MRLVPLLVDSAMNIHEEMNAGLFLSLLTPRSFLMLADTFCFVEPRACGPPLSVGSIGWICQVKENVRSSKDGASPISRSRSGAKTKTPATYCTGPSTRHSTFVESEPRPLHCARTVERPATSVHRYRFILRTWSSLTTLRGLVKSQSCLVRRNWTKKRECSTGTTANKDRNYIDNSSSPSPSLRL